MSFLPVIEYLAGLTAFGFFYWIMNGVLDELRATGIQETGDVYTLLVHYLWVAILIIYLLFGGWWLVRKYDEHEYMGGR